jgi:competence protein ComEA
MRWQGGLVAAPEAPGEVSGPGGSRERAESRHLGTEKGWEGASHEVDGEDGEWWAGPHPGDASDSERRDAARPDAAPPDAPDPDPPAWPVPGMWVRLVALLAVIVAIGGVAVLLTSWPWEQQPESVAVARSAASGDPFTDPFQAASPSASPPVTVHVVGDVRTPGVVHLPAGSRVVDAVKAAGGLRRGGELGGTNLARLLADGERIEVGGSDAAGSGGSGGTIAGSAGPLDLNTATAEQLDTLPGVGPVTAAKILAWRSTHNRFSVVDELAEVPGIGPKTLADLRPLVRV